MFKRLQKCFKKRKKLNQITFDILMQQKLFSLCCKKEPSPVLSSSSLKINLSSNENAGQGTKIPEFYSRSDPGFSCDFCAEASVPCAFDFYCIISKFGQFLVYGPSRLLSAAGWWNL